MKTRRLYFLSFLWICAAFSSIAPRLRGKTPGDRAYTVSADISNQRITSFAEDAQGYVWIGTARGANRYNVREFYQYFGGRDSLSISGSQVMQIFRDSKDRLWFCTTKGVCLYTDKDCFRRIAIETKSQNAVQILEDRRGRILLNMVGELCRYDEEEQVFRVAIGDFDREGRWSNQCFIDAQGDLWSVSGSTIRRFDAESLQLKSKTEAGVFVHYAFLDNEAGELYLAAGTQLKVFRLQSGEIREAPEAISRHPLLSQTVITCIHPYAEASLLISTLKGLFLYNVPAGEIIRQGENGFPFQAPDFRITTMFTDSQQNLWIGSEDRGFVTKYSYRERFNNNSYLVSHFENKSTTSLGVDSCGNLWATTSRDGLFLYDAEDRQIRRMNLDSYFPERKYFENPVIYLFIDRENLIWLITETGRLMRCRYRAGRLQVVESYSLPTSISAMTQDAQGAIYAIGFNASLFVLAKGAKEFQARLLYPPDTYVFTNCLITLSDGRLCVSSFGQNARLIDPQTWEIETVNIQDQIPDSPCVPTAVYEDSRGYLWIGTYLNGLYRYDLRSGRLEAMPGAACSDIAAIREDRQGNLWVSTLAGLSKYDPKQNRFVNYYKSDGVGGNQFNERSVCLAADGTLIFGGAHGLTSFDPEVALPNRRIPLLFEELKIHNRAVSPLEGGAIDKRLACNPVVRLKHHENSFSLSFAALDYREYEQVHYYYKMEGFNKNWVDAGNNREASYSNLPPGRYTFRVKITDKDRSGFEVENAIALHILPPLGRTRQAYCAYCLAALGLAFFVFRLWRALSEKKREKTINKMNMNFFANVSHEFRTPLTMIAGPVAQLCEDKSLGERHKQLLCIVSRSVDRMLKLVNQLMDFNRLEDDALKLRVERADLIAELNRLIEIFRLNARLRQIALLAFGLEDSFITWFDADKLDKITGNLLTNALKYTPSGGKIALSFDVVRSEELPPGKKKASSAQWIKLSVSDTGAGIPGDQLERIFERYYRIDPQGRENRGAGIGLYYARRLAELHHGYIKAENAKDGPGSVFTLWLPADEKAYSAAEKKTASEEQQEVFPLPPSAAQYLGATEDKANRAAPYKILVVDDDSEIVHYLETLLAPHYRVISCYNARRALKLAEEESPDLALCDVVMSNISGYDFCRTIKNDLQLCHIPVILLTAKTMVENQVEGLNSDADAYVTKPFDPAYLLALIKSQLKNRENVRNLLGRETQTGRMEANILSPRDNAFMTELYRLMETELSNPELNIAYITEAMRISRTKLYYKIKGLTGNNPNVFFKTYKLNRAAELLKEGKYNISEIADMTGFNTLSHFSASFKKQFGLSPREYG